MPIPPLAPIKGASHREAPSAPLQAPQGGLAPISGGGARGNPPQRVDYQAADSYNQEPPSGGGGSVRYDSYSLVADAVRAGRDRVAAAAAGSAEAQRGPRLVAVAWIDTWAPPAQVAAQAVEAVRTARDCPFAQLFIVEATEHSDKAWEFGVVTTPAMQFYWDGAPVKVRRPDWEDDNKLTGPLMGTKLLEVLRHVRTCCDAGPSELGQYVLSLDF